MPLRSRADLIPIRIVVRDHQGRPVANLRKEDFRVFEDRKPQDISYFSVETPDTILQTFGVSAPSIDKPAADKNEPSEPTAASVRPSHFVALLFDDLHDTVEDLFHTRDAAIHFIDGSLAPNDRIGIFTISGKSQADFTTDRDKLRATLLGLRQQSVAGAMPPGTRQCPTIDYYQADQILNKGNALEGDPEPGNPHEPIGQHDQQNPALLVAIYDALNCAYGDDKALLQEARQLAMSTAKRVEEEGQVATRDSFRRLTELVRAIAALPGQRSVSVLSPGFIAPKNQQELADVIDRANRLNVFINTLDARGVYAPDLGDASLPRQDGLMGGGFITARARLRTQGQEAQSAVLHALAEGTGGRALQQNDLNNEVRSLAELPAVSYLIAFTPHNLKYDGKFHSLKVKLDTKEHVTIQARRGFYDPKQN